jgi:predicted TIM-barrel fold metal-dependent hydrolase
MGLSEHWFRPDQLKKVSRAYEKDWETPIPTQQVSNGEYMPAQQTKQQAEVEARIKEKADLLGKKHGLSRREFLKTASGMAAAFLAMNEVYGNVFHVDPAEAVDPDLAGARLAAMQNQLIIDDQTHFIRDDYSWEGLNFLREFAMGNNPEKTPWNRALVGKKPSLKDFHFENYLKDIYLDSDTTIALLSNATFDDPAKWLLSNDVAAQTRDMINKISGTRRMIVHGLFWPGHPGNLEDMERSAALLKVDAWKGYTVGDPLGPSDWPWMMDDEKVTYSSYQIADKVGIRNICVHKGLMPDDYEKAFPTWKFAKVDDLGKCAKDWPQLNFIIYHSAIRPLFDAVKANADFEKTGTLPWIDDLAEIPAKFGVNNVYGEIGSSFAMTAITYPKMCAYMLGRLVKGLGADHVVWGSDSIWYGSPAWQIDAFRRIEIPLDMQKKFGFMPLGPGDGPVKAGILGYNTARLYNVPLTADGRPVENYANDGLAKVKADYQAAGPSRSNMYYGWIRKERAKAHV